MNETLKVIETSQGKCFGVKKRKNADIKHIIIACRKGDVIVKMQIYRNDT